MSSIIRSSYVTHIIHTYIYNRNITFSLYICPIDDNTLLIHHCDILSFTHSDKQSHLTLTFESLIPHKNTFLPYHPKSCWLPTATINNHMSLTEVTGFSVYRSKEPEPLNSRLLLPPFRFTISVNASSFFRLCSTYFQTNQTPFILKSSWFCTLSLAVSIYLTVMERRMTLLCLWNSKLGWSQFNMNLESNQSKSGSFTVVHHGAAQIDRPEIRPAVLSSNRNLYVYNI